MEVAWRVWHARPPTPSLTVVVKGTFDLVPEGRCPLSAEQALATGDEHLDDDAERSLRYASDLEVLKPRGECWVVGSFHAPGGRPVTHSTVALTVGPVAKQLSVVGDRVWRGGRMSEPKPVRRVPLCWEESFGGASVAANPVGKGLDAVEQDGGRAIPLPRIEDPMAPLIARDARPVPAGVAPVPRTWAARRSLAGTYDEAWLQARYPGYPEDLDWRFFNAAPADQQIEGYWRGDEEIALRNLHPAHALVRCRLPGLRPQAFVVRDDSLVDVGLVLDTLVIDADEGRVHAVWRGVTEVGREDLSDVTHLWVGEEQLGAGLGVEGHAAAYHAALAAREAEEAEAASGAPAPRPAADEALAAALDPEAPGARWAHLDQAMTVRSDDAAFQQALRQAREEKLAAASGLRPVFDDALGLADAMDAAERALTPEERLELEMQHALGDLLDGQRDRVRESLREALLAKESLAGRDLAGADLSAFDLVEIDLRGAILARANLSGARLERCLLEGAVLAEAELSQASFSGCDLREADLTSVRAQRVRLLDCDLRDASVGDSFLREARLHSCRLERATLAGSDLAASDFASCRLDEADLSASVLDEAVFRQCSLVDAWLEGGVRARKLRLEGCDATLLRASEEADLEDASFEKATLDGARFGGARLRGAKLNLASLRRADFSDAFLHEASLVGCDLRLARFDRASMVRAVLMKSNLMQARFEEANLAFADLRGANLYQAELYRAQTAEVRWDLADRTGTRLA
ncbi:MAG TPA: DUF2169 domain-containing protein [Sandaracinaceae bacterium LLY-WYZ-13_1]|nr:DUF2169 domain-containing protein [Sandaracinaceae bacterium LLY-WYZ-13_1]